MARHTLDIKVSEELATTDQRDFVKNYLTRATPGIRFAFMSEGSLRDGVRLQRSPTKIKVTI